MTNFIFKYLHRKRQRFCRVGAGDELTTGKCDTPGFKYCNRDIIHHDSRGFKVLQLKRCNCNRFIQSSMNLLQSWRANSDVKILIYDTDPSNPDMAEISRVSDYIVAYTCKGHVTLYEEQNIIESAIKRYVYLF